jgi:membrane-bound lytic murein transglycosylase F
MAVRRALAISVCVLGGVARQSAADPAKETPESSSLARTESGGADDEDSAPDGLVSRASGRPDHPRSLEEIRKSGYIRVLTRNNDTSFFIYRGHRMGFDYEVGKKLAQRLGIRVDMVVTANWGDMVPRLLRGEADVIAAEVTVTEARKQQVLFAEPWGKTREVVVYKQGAPPVRAPEDLAGKEVRVRKSSTYHQTLVELSRRLESQGREPVRISIVPEDWETDTVLEAVSEGEILYTVADALLADIHAAYFPVRKSWMGAQGLFQIMPGTAKGLGISDPADPEQSIRGGLKYMQQLHEHYQDVADPIERYRFALAAYNTGFGHVDDARRLCKAAGKDHRRWREVAAFLLKLSDRRYAAKTRFGFCRGIEPVDYVRHIDERYAGYVQLVPLAQAAER